MEAEATSKSPLSSSSASKNYRTKSLALCFVLTMLVPQSHCEGIEERLKYELVGKTCGEGNYGPGLEEAREAALAAVEEGVGSSGNGFYDASYAAVRAEARCQADLWGCDCEECVSGAVEVLREECRGKPAGEVYFDGCSVTYFTSLGDTNGSSHGKLIAIVLGGAASLGLGFIILIGFFKS